MSPHPDPLPEGEGVLQQAPKESVVLIHGLWLSGWCLIPLAKRLRHAGFSVQIFSYPSVRSDLRANAERLQQYLSTLPAEEVHLVGHSLGGILIRALHHYYSPQRPGRIVTLASPHHGSIAAQALARSTVGRWMLGRSVAQLLEGQPQGWSVPLRDIGIIRGCHAIGLGRLLTRLTLPNDGVLTEVETGLAGAVSHVAIPASHSGLLLSCEVARQVSAFLRSGRFLQ